MTNTSSEHFYTPRDSEALWAPPDIDKLISNLAEQVLSDYSANRIPTLVSVIPEALYLSADLARRLGSYIGPELEFMEFTNRHVSGSTSTASEFRTSGWTSASSLEGRHALFVYTRTQRGASALHLERKAKAMGAASIATLTLIDQPIRGSRATDPTYTGTVLELPHEQLFGYGIKRKRDGYPQDSNLNTIYAER
ncbi:MAG TPA: hypothetical protein VJ836_02765 [Candidatus Saccharimonadales bacterium]|nr:hypothetical protein [Candidatus Saccharimonadales bacterium]